jgi:hypothetical protein
MGRRVDPPDAIARSGKRSGKVQRRFQVLQDWIRVEDYEVDAGEVRTFEFHVVQDEQGGRVTLTIKCLDAEEKTVRLDPTVLGSAEASFPQIAERRVKRLYAMGLI